MVSGESGRRISKMTMTYDDNIRMTEYAYVDTKGRDDNTTTNRTDVNNNDEDDVNNNNNNKNHNNNNNSNYYNNNNNNNNIVFENSGDLEDVVHYKEKMLKTSTTSRQCICSRDVVELKCTKCNKCFKGRVNVSCTVHRNVHYLMDITHCPSCQVEI